MARSRRAPGVAATALLLANFALASAQTPDFRPATIVSGLTTGYQVVLTDLTRDGRPDVIVVDERSDVLAWYESPTWERRVLAVGVPRPINLAPYDLDDDGVPEIALAHDFAQRPDRSVGQVLLLRHAGDPRQPWRAEPIDRVPTAHRVRWLPRAAGESPRLIVSPLAGDGVVAPAYDGVTPIFAYEPGIWTRTRVLGTLRGIVHGVEPVEWAPGDWQVLTASFDGVHRLEPRATGEWTAVRLHAGNAEPCPRCGASDVKLGRLGARRFIATIEPWHGSQVVVYLEGTAGWERVVIEDAMVDGHALAVGDLDGDGRDEIVGGFRGKGFRISAYRASDGDGRTWTRTVLDEGGVAGADCRIADLTGDRRADVVCSGASTGNVVLFEQR